MPRWLRLALLALAACGKSREVTEELATKTMIAEQPVVKDFHRLFPDSMGYFTHYGDDLAPTIWHSRAAFHGRYLLHLEVEVSFEKDRVHVMDTGPYRFTFVEVESLTPQEDGRIRIKYRRDSQVEFGADEWAVVVNREGDLSSVGIQMSKDEPHPDFDKLWRQF